MGKKYIKYIIELPENVHWIQWIMEGTKDHHPYMDWKLIEDLIPYTEPDLEHVRKEAYEQGYYIGYSKYLNRSYEDGLKASWEAARKIICEMDYEDHMKIFGGDNLDYIFALSPTTVIEKLKAYEQEQKEIKVGDEVENTQTGVKFIVTHQWKNNRGEQGVSGFNYGCSAFSTALDLVRKTGRHFPEIASALEKMRGE